MQNFDFKKELEKLKAKRLKIILDLRKKGQTLKQVGDRFGIRDERVRKIIENYEKSTKVDKRKK